MVNSNDIPNSEGNINSQIDDLGVDENLNYNNSNLDDVANENKDLLDSLKRTQADFINYKKRSEREFLEVYDVAEKRLAKELLPLLDEIILAKSHNLYEGSVKSLGEKIIMLCEKLKVEAFGEVGEDFDPNIHNSIDHTPEELDKILIDVIYQQGFKIGNQVVREAIVGTRGKN